ncbi:hypothetical protein EI42_00151 [Thermosporothrix hazakensis]|uniref:Uncharacterized protein n=2 Tax=Thermosporothrix TaxID=768650 RepID=A0A326UD77_THEHA|nr:hypothetical protein [Thermosporothrix hazakensis]PZW35984.1 hypothetical protein EI42_00151 [Thermosporothrix hazakensis]BBH88452.1 hypothetical protein KTC_32030 [Thermosporothrix sp. COM3]GCE46638.1 hypothetical protein KTH_15070 [Thermosporothrix hazakensis]
MNYPVSFGVPQIILTLMVLLGLSLLFYSLFTVVKRHRVVFDEESGKRYRVRRRVRWKHGASGGLLLALAILLLWASSLLQSYIALTGDVLVARVQATSFTNMPHSMNLELTQFDENGKVKANNSYLVKGDQWMLQGNILKFPGWMNLLGFHTGYKLTRLQGRYEDPNLERTAERTVIELNGGDGDFFKTVYKQAWSSPFVEAAYGQAVFLPADGLPYNIYANQSGIYAKPAK